MNHPFTSFPHRSLVPDGLSLVPLEDIPPDNCLFTLARLIYWRQFLEPSRVIGWKSSLQLWKRSAEWLGGCTLYWFIEGDGRAVERPAEGVLGGADVLKATDLDGQCWKPESEEMKATQMTREARKDDDGDYLFDALSEYLEHVMTAYRLHESKKPVMLFDVQEKRIYAYGYEGFKSELSATSQVSLAEQYNQTQRSGKMVVFVRDNDNRRLVSYSIDCE